MPSRTIVAALFVLLCGAAAASAQALLLEFHDGRVRLTAENVPVSRILAEWTRVGGTQIVNGERVPGAPVTLQLDAPERQALDTVLRGAAGYMVLARDTTSAGASAGASAFDKILVLPTTSRAPAPGAAPQAAAQAPQVARPEQEPIDLQEADENPQAPPPPVNFPRGRAPGLNLPNAPNPNQMPRDLPNGTIPTPRENRENEGPPATEPVTPPPGNPFGIVPGPSRPGTINPPPARDPNAGPTTR
jgi:hypothetical protein